MKAIEGKFDTRLSAWRDRGKTGNGTGKSYDTLLAACHDKELDYMLLNRIFYVNKKEAHDYLAARESEAADPNQETSAEDSSDVLMTKVLAFMVDWVNKNGGVVS